MIQEEVPQPEETKLIQEEGEQEGTEPLSQQTIKDNIEAAIKWQKSGHYKGDNTRWKQWEKNKQYLMCVWDSEEGDVAVNSIYSNYHTARPILYFRNPGINVSPTKPNFQRDQSTGQPMRDGRGMPILVDNYKASRVFGIKINYELKELNFKKWVKKCVGDVLNPYGIAWMKWGYDKISGAGADNNRTKSRKIWCRRVDPRNLVYDWMATDIDDCRFIAERLVLTRKEARDNGFKIPDDYICSLPDFLQDRAKKASAGKEDDGLVVVWEYHDLEANVLYWQLETNGKDADKDPPKAPEHEPYPFEGSSYVPLVFNEDNDDIIGLSDVEPIEDQAKAINRIRSKQTKHVESFGTHMIAEETAIDDKELDNTKTNTHGLITIVKDGGLNRIRTEGTPAMGQDNYAMDSVHKSDMRETIGTTEYQKGGGGGDRTATEAGIIQNAATVRVTERRDVIYDFVINNIRKCAALIQEFSGEEDFINVEDEDFDDDLVEHLTEEYGFNPKIPFLRIPRDRIQGEWDFEFKMEDMISRPKEVQVQQWIQIVGLMANPLIMEAAQEEDIALGKVLNKLFELNDLDINEVKHGGPTQIPAIKENLMFEDGKEVPEPHRKDNDAEHNLTHLPTAQKLEQAMQQLMGQKQQYQQLEMAAAQGQVPPEQMQQVQELGQASQQLDQQLMQLEAMLKRIKIHMQAHDEKSMAKEQKKLRKSAAPMQAAPNPNVSAQAQIRGQAGG